MEYKRFKFVRTEGYNYNFDRKTGEFIRWGKTLEDDPIMAPLGPEIADIEVSSGKCSGNCKFCYKGNTAKQEAKNMDLDTFKKVFNKICNVKSPVLTQIALGITDIETNPDLYKIMEYCRNNEYNYVVPNITINGYGLTDEHAQKLVSLCGAIAVSNYNKDLCYNAVKKLTDLGLNQTNIHQLFAFETYEKCFEVVKDMATDKRLEKLNAVVFLMLKPKNRGTGFHQPTKEQIKTLIEYCINNNVRIGFDSCSAQWFEWVVKNMDIDEERKQKTLMMSESCESGLMSSYINVEGDYFPCSFAEGVDEWKEGISVKNCDDFLKDVWHNERVIEWRDKLLNKYCKNNCRKCAVFPSINVEE